MTARQAEAERDRRAKVILAEGEQQAAAKLAEAAQVLAAQEGSMQLRYLNTLQEIAGDQTNTIVFPFAPDDVKKMFRVNKEFKCILLMDREDGAKSHLRNERQPAPFLNRFEKYLITYKSLMTEKQLRDY